jgi:WD40 repeat protein
MSIAIANSMDVDIVQVDDSINTVTNFTMFPYTEYMWFSVDGSTVSCFNPSGECCVVDSQTGEFIDLFKFGDGHAFTPSPDRSVIACLSQDSRLLSLWRQENNSFIEYAQLPMDYRVNCLCYSPDGQLLLLGMSNGDIEIRAVVTGHFLKYRYASDHPILSIDCSVHKIMATSLRNNTLQIWKHDYYPVIIHTPGESPIRSIKFSPDGSTLATFTGGDQGLVRLWDVRTLEMIMDVEMRVNTRFKHVIVPVCFSDDGQFLYTCNSNVVNVWNLVTGDEPEEIIMSYDVTAIAVKPQGVVLM